MRKYSFFLKQIKYDFLIFFREPLFAFPILFLPALFFAIFSSIYGQGGNLSSFERYIPTYAILISFLTIFFNIGVQSVNDRELGVYKRIIVSPTNIYFIVATYIVRGVIISFVGLLEMLLLAKFAFNLPISENLPMFTISFLLIIGVLLLISLSLHGFFKNSRQVVPFTVLAFQYVMFSMEFMFQISDVPKVVRYLIYINPAYHMNELSVDVWLGNSLDFTNILVLFISSIVCVFLLLIQKRKEA